MGMKVAAVSTLCQDSRIFAAMEMAGTPCPYEGKIGTDAKKKWEENPEKLPVKIEEEQSKDDKTKGFLWGVGGATVLAGILILAL